MSSLDLGTTLYPFLWFEVIIPAIVIFELLVCIKSLVIEIFFGVSKLSIREFFSRAFCA